MRKAVIFDMDGTLANVSSIRHFVKPNSQRKWKNFDAFHAESVNVEPNSWVVAMAQIAEMRGLDVLIVTARRAKWRHHTAWWLALNNVPSVAMYMRGDKDGRPDVEVKRDMLAHIQQTHDVVLAVDDNPNVLALWQQHGIPTITVPGWED